MEPWAISGSVRRCAALAVVAAMAAFAGCSGHGSGGTGDPASVSEGDLYGDGDRIDDFFGKAKWYDASNTDSVDCKSPEPERIEATGLTVVAVDNFDEINENRKGNIYAVQTPGKKGLQPYDGITLRTPSFTPPDLRLFSGEVVDATGNFVEFLGPPSASLFGNCKTLPQIEGTVTYRFDGAGVAPYELVPPIADTPEGVDRWAPLKSYQAARPFIGMLVRIHDVQVLEKNIGDRGDITIPLDVGGGLAASDVPSISNELYDIAATGPAIPDLGKFESITGVVTYFYNFKIAPRSPADFVRAPE